MLFQTCQLLNLSINCFRHYLVRCSAQYNCIVTSSINMSVNACLHTVFNQPHAWYMLVIRLIICMLQQRRRQVLLLCPCTCYYLTRSKEGYFDRTQKIRASLCFTLGSKLWLQNLSYHLYTPQLINLNSRKKC